MTEEAVEDQETAPAPDEGGQKLSALEKRIQAAKRAKAALEARDDFLRFVKFTMPDIEDPEKMEKTPTRDKAVTLGILGDQLKSGGPSSLTINITAPDHRDLETYLAKLRPADVIEATPGQMGLEPGEIGAKGGCAAGLEDAGEDAGVVDLEGAE
jgi:hypothetical protein